MSGRRTMDTATAPCTFWMTPCFWDTTREARRTEAVWQGPGSGGSEGSSWRLWDKRGKALGLTRFGWFGTNRRTGNDVAIGLPPEEKPAAGDKGEV